MLLSGTNQEKKKKVSDYDIFVTHSVAAFKQDVGTPPKKCCLCCIYIFDSSLVILTFFFWTKSAVYREFYK